MHTAHMFGEIFFSRKASSGISLAIQNRAEEFFLVADVLLMDLAFMSQ